MTQPAGPTEADLAKLEAELDPEMQFRPLLPAAGWIVAGLLMALSLFHYYTAGFGLLRETTHRGIHMAFVLGLIFLVFAASRRLDAAAEPSVPSPRSLRGEGQDEGRGESGASSPGPLTPALSPQAGRGSSESAGPLKPFGIPIWDWALAAAAAVSSLYVPWIFEDLAFRVGNPLTIDVVMGTLLIVVLLEATRRSVGLALPLIAIFLMLYALYGQSFPGIFVHPGNTWKGVVNHLYLTSQGIFGIALGVVATYVFHYVLFGVLATRIGLGRFFIDLASAAFGRFVGGPAKVSIFGSGLFGMISGSSIANTVTVGSLTIPAMIRLGYPRHFAAAVESTASTGGQITPPIMGAAAFLMVEYLNVPYQTVILAAIVPASMHFFGVFCQVHFEAKKNGMRGMEPHEIPRASEVIRRDWPTSIPLFVLLAVLFSGYTPYLAAFWGITACIVVGMTHRHPLVAVATGAAITLAAVTGLLKTGPATLGLFATGAAVSILFMLRDAEGRKAAIDIADAFVTGAKYAIAVGAAAATVGIIVGVVTLTGVGFKISNIVTTSAGTIAAALGTFLPAFLFDLKAMTLFFTLVMTAIVCILLGCGVPTTATYIIMVTVAAPALSQLGSEPIIAHFFVFYFGVLADITPPVALAAYAGASMAGADPFKTGNTAFRLGLAKALVPFVFAYAPAMLIVTKGFTWAAFVEVTLTCALGILALAAALTGFARAALAGWERLLLGAAALLLMAPGWGTAAAAAVLAAPVILRQARAP